MNAAAAISPGPPSSRTHPRLWQARYDAYWSVGGAASRRGGGGDRCLRADFAACRLRHREDDLKRLDLLSPIVEGVGDGNFHCSLVCDVDNAEEMARGEEFMHRLVERAIDGRHPVPASTASGRASRNIWRRRPRARGSRRHARAGAGARSAKHLQSRKDRTGAVGPSFVAAKDTAKRNQSALRSFGCRLGEGVHGFVDTVEDLGFRQDIVDLESLERVPGSRGIQAAPWRL